MAAFEEERDQSLEELYARLLDGAINGDWFEAYVEEVLVPSLRAGDRAMSNNLASHTHGSVRAMILAAGVRPRVLPSYNSDFNSI